PTICKLINRLFHRISPLLKNISSEHRSRFLLRITGLFPLLTAAIQALYRSDSDKRCCVPKTGRSIILENISFGLTGYMFECIHYDLSIPEMPFLCPYIASFTETHQRHRWSFRASYLPVKIPW